MKNYKLLILRSCWALVTNLILRAPRYTFSIETALLLLSAPAAQAGVHWPWLARSKEQQRSWLISIYRKNLIPPLQPPQSLLHCVPNMALFTCLMSRTVSVKEQCFCLTTNQRHYFQPCLFSETNRAYVFPSHLLFPSEHTWAPSLLLLWTSYSYSANEWLHFTY